MSTAPSSHVLTVPVLERIVGQDRARDLLSRSITAPVHAYLFVGPPGAGKHEAARAFAAALVCEHDGCGVCDSCTAVLAGRHPDVVTVERSGASLLVRDAEQVVSLSMRTPRAARRQVIVLSDFHLVDEVAPMLLKSIEEPPSTTVFVMLADAIPLPLVTIASRSVRVEFSALGTESIQHILRNEGVPAQIAAIAADSAGGRIDRARLLASDSGFAERQALWASVPERLDGLGTTVVSLARELLSSCDELVAVLRERQSEELSSAAAEAERSGLRAIPGRQAIEDRHRRELRRVRTDELRAGLASLALSYRRRLDAPEVPARRFEALAQACRRIDEVATTLVRNPNELLLIEALLLELDSAR